VAAVDDLSLKVKTGEILGLLGPNGAGKSTTLYMLAGLVRPNTGSISIFGMKQGKSFLEIARSMGVLVERPMFFDYMSVRRNMQLQARLAHYAVNVDRALDLAGMLHLAGRKAGTLSHGQRQRLGLAQAILTEPKVLILDEPTSGLDVEASQEILRLLRRLSEEAGVTTVVSSHLLQEVEVLCDRVAILNQGKLVSCEKIDRLLSYDHTRVEVLVEGAEGAAKRLIEQLWVDSVELFPGRLLVHLTDNNVAQLNAFLVNAGYQISGLLPKRRTLQDYFLQVLNANHQDDSR
jgi:ABC-2 type transport system ATP-binding protein